MNFYIKKNEKLNKIILIDACRTNSPANIDLSTGNSSSINSSNQSIESYKSNSGLIGFATYADDSAYEDQLSRHGVFTSSLLKFMQVSNLSVSQLIKEVTQEVKQQTNGAQTPIFAKMDSPIFSILNRRYPTLYVSLILRYF